MSVRPFLVIVALFAACTMPLEIPTENFGVTASISSVSLAEDCAKAQGAPSAEQGICADGANCPSLCQQSNLQLSLTSTNASARIEIAAVRIHSMKTGAMLDDLVAREPRTYSEGAYVLWTQELPAQMTLQVSYNLDAPNWSTISSQSTRYSSDQARGETFRVEVDLKVNDVLRTIFIDGVSREPLVAT